MEESLIMIDAKVMQNCLKMLLSLKLKLTNFNKIIVNYRRAKDLRKKISANLIFVVKASPKIVRSMIKLN